jgi:hypothetical protein
VGIERQPNKELPTELITAYSQTFISRNDLYPLQLQDGKYVLVHKPVTPETIAAHIKGYLTIGTYALDPNGWAKWICLDADDEKRWKGLLRLAKALEKEAIVPYIELSRRGGHLWLFTPPIPGFQIRRFGKQLLAKHKLKQIEIYPKQDKPITGPGSLVRLPLGIHRLTGKRYHFISPDGEPLAPTIREQIQLLAQPRLVSLAFIDQVLARAPEGKAPSPTPRFILKPEADTSGPVSERIKNRISVYDFVGQYVELDPRGYGYCPFHDDQHKSFGVNQDGNFWSCFASCGGGSIIDFWMKWREKHNQTASFKATVTELANMLL